MLEIVPCRAARPVQVHLLSRVPRPRLCLGGDVHPSQVAALLVFLACLLTTRSSAQNPTYSLGGSVVSSVTGEPIPRALVQMFGAASNSALTDSDGHFQFEGLAAMQAALLARKPGFFNEQEASRGQGISGPTRVTIGPNTPSVVLKLLPEGVISGHMTADGEAIENIPVKLFHLQIMDGRRRWEQAGNATTDSDGEFRIASLVPGKYYAAFGPSWSPIGAVGGPKSRQRGYAEVFFPGVPDLASAAPIDLSGGQQFEADMSLKAEPLYHVSGTISGYAAPQGVNLSFVNSAGDTLPFPVQFSRQGSEFQAQVTSGSYTLHAEAFSENSSLQANLPITINSDMAAIHLVLEPEVSIPVIVRTEFSSSQGAKATPQNMPVTVELISSIPSLAASDYFSGLDTPANPSALAIRDVEPGRYSAQITPNGPFYAQSAQCGGVDLLRDDLTVPAGSRVPPIEVVLRDDGASLTGTVTSEGQPARGAVFLIPDRSPRQAKTTREQNQFRFTNLVPGDYSVFALDRGADLEYTNPDALSPYMGKAAHVTLPPSGSVSLPPLELIHAGK
jgi:hypothetical protein